MEVRRVVGGEEKWAKPYFRSGIYLQCYSAMVSWFYLIYYF